MRRLIIGIISVITSGLTLAQTGDFPDKPVKITVPVTPAGILDQVARIVSPTLGDILGQSVVVENRPGASGNIAATYVARSNPDGYTLLAGYSMFHVGNPVMYKRLSWDPIKDFSPVAMLVVSPHLVAVNPGMPMQSLEALVAYAKKHPGELNYSSPGAGSVPHIGMELFKQRTGIEVTHIAYKGAGPAIQDVLAGHVQMTVATPPSLASFVAAGTLRPLAIASKERIPLMPDVPTTAEAGYPGFELDAWVALFAPQGTPAATIAKLSSAVEQTLKTEAVRTALVNVGVQVRYMSPTQLDEQVRRDIDYWQPVIRDAGISIE
ncbi:Bug family tripartite tricarboxylate transporter substrate binding protein [Pollutimonas sp. M17]|uniref:Bug family tripartite tricarboxylate transporter substrate binding protein n=1 Tax=Pollutimonas sp. M17 TaxID=2962065 RepID=UPI0021F3FAC2|nr:tripartite tricarboxylate transporter substrate binding protein [Pollutimonas sp. M17]UYO94687.1 tripartite tricarboxylate transporter substrate binding protein [Pollutimonas sp. M17]